MPLFTQRPRASCSHCGGEVKQPKDPAYYLCPQCEKPGPWASPEQVQAWKAWVAEQQTLEGEQQTARQRQLQAAASLTPTEVPGFMARKGESVYFAMQAELAEWKKAPGHYEGGGGIRGLSFGVPGLKGVRAYTGGLSQRKYVAGGEGWVITDSGTAVITSQRIVFRGGSKAIEWAYPKIVGLDADRSNGCLVLQVTNRQKANVLKLEDFEVFEAALEPAIKAYQEG